MNVKIIRMDNGQEIDIKHLDKEFAGQFLSNNPFGLMIMATMAILKDALQPTEEKGEEELNANLNQEVYQDQPNLVLDAKEPAPKEDLFAEEAQCTGDSNNCPVCNGQQPLSVVDFGEALAALRDGKKVIRHEWFGLDVSHLFLFEGNDIAYPAFLLEDSENQKVYPYTFQHDDLLAEDWIILED